MAVTLSNFIRALRLPFSTVSILGFICGSLIALPNFNWIVFALGLLAALATHLSANLLNDYADSKSGADWKDKQFYRFFGGSKLIQEGVLSESFYLKIAIFFAGAALSAVGILAFLFKDWLILVYYAVILLLGWSYSLPPAQLCYHRLGELVIFILFGPALVMGGYFTQTQVFPALESFVVALPFGFFTVAILYANEVPDFSDDQKALKHTLVSLIGPQKAYVFYDILMSCGFLSILAGIYLGYLSLISLSAFPVLFLSYKATRILKTSFADKLKLTQASKLTIAAHALVSIVLIADMLL
ncbi:MAG: prenyltransferase [Candidatus Omnitrophota bacterium]